MFLQRVFTFLLLFFLANTWSSPLLAGRVTRAFGSGNSVRVISDKGFSYPETKVFEASGNVVISHGHDSIYGEKATFDMKNKTIKVIGNVRFIGPDITFYGSKLDYDLQKKEFEIFNARVLSDDFIVLGKKIRKSKSSKIYVEGAEYTTCQDCPESWTIYGDKVTITPHKYIQIKHAYLKAKGVVFMYIPYILFPIKTKRESGILVPQISFESNEGLHFQQPFFWAIDRSTDTTITPSSFGLRGLGAEAEYRKQFAPKKWFELSTLMLNDQIYQPNSALLSETVQSGESYFRHYSTVEYHYAITDRLQHHSYGTLARDGDMSRVFDQYISPREFGSEQQVKTFFDYRGNVFQFDATGTFNRNLVYQLSDSLDSSYVQHMPRISFNMLPISIFSRSSEFLHNISFGFNFDYTHFKQNHTDELLYYRNAKRINYEPYVNFSWGQVGPTYISSKLTLDGQKYSFPTQGDETFSKYSVLITTEMSLELEKFWGSTKTKKVPLLVNSDVSLQVKKNSLLIGTIPVIDNKGNAFKIEKQSSYKHSQLFLLKHYYTTDSHWSGSEKFYQQIQDEEGGFDYRDSLIEKNYLLSDDFSRTSIPLSNTLEIQWNNSLTKKSIKGDHHLKSHTKNLREQFSYERIAYANLSQGYVLDAKGDLEDHLSRLNISMGVTLDKWNIFLNEYYFYQGGGHIFDTGLSYMLPLFKITSAYNYNYFSVPTNKRVKTTLELKPLDLFSFDLRYDYDIENQEVIESNYRILYTPLNNCWRLAVGYKKTLIKSSYAINFLFNFGGGSFSSFE